MVLVYGLKNKRPLQKRKSVTPSRSATKWAIRLLTTDSHIQTSPNQRLPVISARTTHERTTFDFRPRPLKSKLSIHRANSVSGKMESNITHGGPQTSPSN